MAESSARYLQELGPNLKKIATFLLKNENLRKLLYNEGPDPLNEGEVTEKQVYQHGNDGLLRVIPIITDKDNEKSIITFRVIKGVPSKNPDFLDIYLAVEVFVPNNQWLIKGDNLRPYAIMGEIQKSLEGKKINGLGKISGSGFDCNFFTDEISAFLMRFAITQYM